MAIIPKKLQLQVELITKGLSGQIAELKKDLSIEKATNKLAKFGLEKAKDVAEAVAGLSDEAVDFIVKALDEMEAKTAVAIEKAIKDADGGETELQKSLSAETGEDGEAEAPVEKSMEQKCKEAYEEQNAKGDK
jgi:hypothetical protein